MKTIKRFWRPAMVAMLAVLLPACSYEIDYDRYAIVYGISDYALFGTGSGDLEFCHVDAEDMASLLYHQGYEVLLQTDLSATYSQLEADIATVEHEAGAGDLFLFYFSGHGLQSSDIRGGESTTADSAQEGILLNEGGDHMVLIDDDLGKLVERVSCDRRIVIIDACNSGGFIDNELEADAFPPDYTGDENNIFDTIGQSISLYLNFAGGGCDIPPETALVISASGEQEYSFEQGSPYNHGIFTYYLLEASTEGDSDRDGFVTVLEALKYVRDKIQTDWNASLGGSYQFMPHGSGGPVDYILFNRP